MSLTHQHEHALEVLEHGAAAGRVEEWDPLFAYITGLELGAGVALRDRPVGEFLVEVLRRAHEEGTGRPYEHVEHASVQLIKTLVEALAASSLCPGEVDDA